MFKHLFTTEDVDSCWAYYKEYLVEILNGEYSVDRAREDLMSLIGSKFDIRTPAPEDIFEGKKL